MFEQCDFAQQQIISYHTMLNTTSAVPDLRCAQHILCCNEDTFGDGSFCQNMDSYQACKGAETIIENSSPLPGIIKPVITCLSKDIMRGKKVYDWYQSGASSKQHYLYLLIILPYLLL
jgi:hypothetical protein